MWKQMVTFSVRWLHPVWLSPPGGEEERLTCPVLPPPSSAPVKWARVSNVDGDDEEAGEGSL